MSRKQAIVSLGLLTMLGLSGCVAAPLPAALPTPRYALPEVEVLTAPTPEEIHTSEEGIIRIPSSEGSAEAEEIADPLTPETVWEEDAVITYNGYTLPEKAMLEEDCLGVLTIPAIELEMSIYEAEDGATRSCR